MERGVQLNRTKIDNFKYPLKDNSKIVYKIISNKFRNR